MSQFDLIRYAVGAAVIWFALQDGPTPLTPSAPYTGSMTALHSESRSMEATDREGLHEALTAIGKMLSDDRMDAIATSSDAQKAIQVGLNFGYSTFQVKKYPQVASVIESELSKAVGTEIGTLSATDKSRIATLVEEMGRAVK